MYLLYMMQVVHRVESHDSVTAELDENYGKFISTTTFPLIIACIIAAKLMLLYKSSYIIIYQLLMDYKEELNFTADPILFHVAYCNVIIVFGIESNHRLF